MKKRLFSLVLSFVIAVSLTVPAFAAGSDFEIQNGVLVKYNGPGGAVKIPDGVSEIGERAFLYCETLTSVSIPDGVTKIGPLAFYGCFDLATVTLPSSVTEIDRLAFCDCESLRNIKIPDGVTTITDKSFAGTGLRSIDIPHSVTVIEVGAFSGSFYLDNVIIPDSVTEIGGSAFWDCKSLSNITIPASVSSIGSDLFTFCGEWGDGGITIHGAAGSAAEQYAKMYAIPFAADLAPVVTPDSFIYSIPNTPEFLRFSASPVAHYQMNVPEFDDNDNVYDKDVTVYEFEVGTKLGLTAQGIAAGYKIFNLSSE